jgi:ArsR family transcriptional regulator
VRSLLSRTGLEVVTAEVACRESKKPHLQVVLAIADRPLGSRAPGPENGDRKSSRLPPLHELPSSKKAKS